MSAGYSHPVDGILLQQQEWMRQRSKQEEQTTWAPAPRRWSVHRSHVKMDQTHACICKGTPTHKGVQKYTGKLSGHCLFLLNGIILRGLMSTLTLLTQKYLLGVFLSRLVWLQLILLSGCTYRNMDVPQFIHTFSC